MKWKIDKLDVECLFHSQKLDVKNESGVLGDTRQALGTVSKRSRDSKSAFTTNLHTSNTQIPTLDDFTTAKAKVERLARDVLIKDLATLELSDITHTDLIENK